MSAPKGLTITHALERTASCDRGHSDRCAPPCGHRSEVLANIGAPVKALNRMLASREFSALLQQEPRVILPGLEPQRRVTPQLVPVLQSEYKSGDSVYVLARRHGIHRNSIAQALKDSGCVMRNQTLSEVETVRARQLARDGLSLNAIGRALGRDPKTIRRAVTSLP